MRAIKFAQILKEQGFWVIPVRPPTVPQGEARLRFSLTYYHDMAVLKRLVDEITQIGI
jgi:8-amino-7-oxononanoate synthase